MSDRANPFATAEEVDSSLSVLVWRQALAKGPRVPRVEDLEAWIGHLSGTGVTAPLERCVAVLRGDGPALMAEGVPEQWTITAALEELRVLAGRVGGAMTLAWKTSVWSGAPDNPAGLAPDRDWVVPGDAGALADDFLSALASSAAASDRRLVKSLAALHDLRWRIRRLDYRDYRHAPLPALITAIATITLVDFALRTRDLWAAPYGSATLMRAAAGFSSTGLGPYCSRVGSIARSGEDIYDLARFAVAASTDAPSDAREAWICFLCRNCRKDLLTQIIDDLGDVAAGRPLTMILRMLVDRMDVDIALLWRLRDAALDNGDWAFAAKAQRLVADARDQDEDELLILGSLYAMSGMVAAAASTFRELAARRWPGAEERLFALRTGTFAPYAIDRGFTSPADRQAVRLHRRGEPPRYSRMRGERINAVDVG